MKPLLVGEVNPYNRSQRYALYPEPKNSAGDRLCRVILGLSARQYLGRFDRMNLCFGRWADDVARSCASQVISSSYGKRQSAVILLGVRVSRAFGAVFEPFTIYREYGFPMVILPHPSGRNLLWNPEDSAERARTVLRRAGVGV